MQVQTSIRKQRESNLELLRIFSMMLVMLVHYLPLRSPTTSEVVLQSPFKAFMNLELNSISFVCVHCFILISGYFGIKWKLKSFLSLIFQLIFWACAGYLIAKYLIAPPLDINGDYSLKTFVSKMLHWYQGRWFVSAYISLYVLSPLINAFIKKTSEGELLKYIIVFYIFSTVFGWFMRSEEFQTGLSAISLIGLYLIGAWLRKSSFRFINWNKWYDLAAYFICTIVLTGVSAILILLGIRSSIYGYLNPTVIVESLFLFQFFRKLKIGKIGWINFLAVSSFSAFLLHCHPYLSGFIGKTWSSLHQYEYALVYVLLSIILIFLISVLIDKIRILIWNAVTKAKNIIMNMISGDNKIKLYESKD